MELIKLGEKTFCIRGITNIGIYVINDNNVCIIDTGNSTSCGQQIDNVLKENNWNLKYIINTHGHADHIGGNKYLQDKYGCQIFASMIESLFIINPFLEVNLLYGAIPPKEMYSSLLLADSSECEDISKLDIEGITILNLKGHSMGHIGIITSDNVCFTGDAYTSEKILNKYKIQYMYDVELCLKTLRLLKDTKYNYYVPAHGEVENDCKNTIISNITNILDIENAIINFIKPSITYAKLIQELFKKYHIKMNIMQYYLIGATLKSYLTKLAKERKIEISFENNEMILKII